MRVLGGEGPKLTNAICKTFTHRPLLGNSSLQTYCNRVSWAETI